MGRDSYALWLVTRGYTKATRHGYLKVYRLWDEWCQTQGTTPARATRSHIARWLLERQGRAPATIRNTIVGLRCFYRYAVSVKARRDDPTEGFRWPKVTLPPISPYTEDELQTFLAAVRSPRDRAMLLVLIDTGLRASELAGMTPADIDWVRGTFIVRGKGNKERRLAHGEETRKALRCHADVRDEHLWGEITTTEGVRAWFWRLAKRAGVPRANLHRFRHTFAAEFLRAGAGEGDLQETLGHESLAMSLHYGRAARKQRAQDQQRRYSLADRL